MCASDQEDILLVDQPIEVDNIAPVLPLPVPTTNAGRPRQHYRLPARFTDTLPEPLAPVTENPPHPTPNPIQHVLLIVRDCLITTANSFGIWRDYPRRPTVDPSSTISLADLANYHQSLLPLDLDTIDPVISSRPSYWPFSNSTIYNLMLWMNNDITTKLETEVTKMVHDVIQSPGFKPEHLAGFDAHKESVRLDKALSDNTTSDLRSNFVESSVDILVPSGSASIPPKSFTVPGLLHRSLTATIISTFSDPLAHLMHFSPFKLFHHNLATHKEEHIHGELYTSDAFLAEHEKLQKYGKLPADDRDCTHEKVIAALMFSSDATHLTDFGNAKAWPIYMMLGNISKYTRASPNAGALHHLAYIPSVSPQQLIDISY